MIKQFRVFIALSALCCASSRILPPVSAEDGLVCDSLSLSIASASLPVLDLSVTVRVSNTSIHSVVIVKQNLRFELERAAEQFANVSRWAYVEPDAANPWFVQPGQTA